MIEKVLMLSVALLCWIILLALIVAVYRDDEPAHSDSDPEGYTPNGMQGQGLPQDGFR